MVSKCIIDTCNTVKAGDGVTLHKLPSNGQVQQEWFRAILNETGQTVFSEDDVICSKHFASDCFTTIDGKILLNPSSVPFESLKKTEPEPKRLKRDKGITNQTQCSVFSCAHSLATTATLKPQLIYHPFPKKKDLVEKWKQFCNKEDDDDFEKCYVCSDHFTDNDYVTKRGSGRLKTLKSEATPTIYKKELSIEEQSELDSSNVSMEATNELEGDGSASNPSGDIETDETAAVQQQDGRVCIVQTCQSRIGTIADLDFYPLPIQENHRKTWIKIIQSNTKQSDDFPSNSVICNLHFTPDCFKKYSSYKKMLLVHAVPSIFPQVKEESSEFPIISTEDFGDPEFGKKFYEWSLKTYQEQKKTIEFLKETALLQSKRIARLAKSVDDFKGKKFVSEEANNALQNLFDKIVDAQYEVI